MNFYKRLKKTALRGNIERMNLPIDPYARQEPGELNEGLSYRVRAGDEEGGSASMGGTRVRGKNFPTGISPKFDDETIEQKKRDIPTSTHYLISNDPYDEDETMKGRKGVKNTGISPTFTDYRDVPTPDSLVWKNDPTGPAQMHGNKRRWETIHSRFYDRKTPYSGTKRRLKGVSNYV